MHAREKNICPEGLGLDVDAITTATAVAASITATGAVVTTAAAITARWLGWVAGSNESRGKLTKIKDKVIENKTLNLKRAGCGRGARGQPPEILITSSLL